MATQDEIDGIDETKPAGTGVPRTAPIRTNFGHIKAALQLLLDTLEGVSAPDLSGYAPLASPALTGIPTAPTASPGTNTTQLATCEYVETAISGLGGGGSALTITAADAITGTIPKLITALTIPAGTWTLSAILGTDNAGTSATLAARKADTTLITSISKMGAVEAVAGTSFTLTADTLLYFYLVGDTSTTNAVVYSLEIY